MLTPRLASSLPRTLLPEGAHPPEQTRPRGYRLRARPRQAVPLLVDADLPFVSPGADFRPRVTI